VDNGTIHLPDNLTGQNLWQLTDVVRIFRKFDSWFFETRAERSALSRRGFEEGITGEEMSRAMGASERLSHFWLWGYKTLTTIAKLLLFTSIEYTGFKMSFFSASFRQKHPHFHAV
jgi:hypothetical protein